jgi:hypothetical protein
MLFRRPPSTAPVSRNTNSVDGRRAIWVLTGTQPTEISIRTGATDGLVTKVLDGDLTDDDTVITDKVMAE